MKEEHPFLCGSGFFCCNNFYFSEYRFCSVEDFLLKFYFPVWMKCIWLAFFIFYFHSLLCSGVNIFYGTVGALNYVVKSDGEWNVNINIFWTEHWGLGMGDGGVCLQGWLGIRFKLYFVCVCGGSVGKYNNISFR